MPISEYPAKIEVMLGTLSWLKYSQAVVTSSILTFLLGTAKNNIVFVTLIVIFGKKRFKFNNCLLLLYLL